MGVPGLDLAADGPLPSRGRGRIPGRSRRPKSNPNATAPDVVELVVAIRRRLARAGLDAGAETIAWHLEHTHSTTQPRPHQK